MRVHKSSKRTAQVDSALRRTKQILGQIYQAIDCPTSLGLYIAVQSDDWKTVVSHSIDPLSFQDPDEFADAYLATKLCSKLKGVPGISDDDRREAALQSYLDVEDDLVRDRQALLDLLYKPQKDEEWAHSVLIAARGKIEKCLGSVDLNEISRGFRFGPGASSSVKKSEACPAAKMKFQDLELSTACIPFLDAYCGISRWGDELLSLRLKEYIRIDTVPKNSLKDRVIGVEPDFNVFVQLGIGNVIRRRLKHVGIDLDHGHKRNANAAMRASRSGSECTIDLSAASDRISLELVRFLLPEDWFQLLNMARTPLAKIGEYPFRLEKFSSMGNGFTFELQSLIFWALCKSVCEKYSTDRSWEVLVFGDDIVAPTDTFDTIERLFKLLSFKVNKEKSYGSGYFRESCGAHCFLGRDVKPFYLKEPLNGIRSQIKLANAIRLYTHRRFGCDVFSTSYSGVYRTIVSWCGRSSRILRTPFTLGDAGLSSFFDEACPRTVSTRRIGTGPIDELASGVSWKVKAWADVVKRHHVDSDNGILSLLWLRDRQNGGREERSNGFDRYQPAIPDADMTFFSDRRWPGSVVYPLPQVIGERRINTLIPSWDDPIVVRQGSRLDLVVKRDSRFRVQRYSIWSPKA